MDLIKDINDAVREKDELEAAIAAKAEEEANAPVPEKTVSDYLTDIQGEEAE